MEHFIMTIDNTERLARALDPTYEEYETFMAFSTPLPCATCGAFTQWAHVARDGNQFTLTPLCPLHGLAQRTYFLGEWQENTALEEEEERASVQRFVLAMHDGQGKGEVLASIDPEDAPGFHVWKREDF